MITFKQFFESLPEMKITKLSSGAFMFEFEFTSGMGTMKVADDGKISSVFLPEKERGVGLGLQLYKKIGRYLANEGIALASGAIVDEAPIKIWDKLVAAGLAEREDRKFKYKFKIGMAS